MKIFAEQLLTDGGFVNKQLVTVENGRIASICPGTACEADRTAKILTTGLFDKHQHGAMGFDCSRPTDEKCRAWTKLLAAHGVTNVLYTVSTGLPGVMHDAIAYCASAMERQKAGEFPGARIEGVHMEGPFISAVRSGAMAKDKIQAPSPAQFDLLTGDHADIVKAISLAPEVEGAAETAKYISARGIRVQAGHTDATCAEAKKAFTQDGVNGITHFYNAARPLQQREPGVLCAAMLDDSVICEAICDFVHVAPEMLRLLITMKTPARVAVISDSVTTAGLPDGEYFGGNHPIYVKDHRNLTASGGIAGGWCQADTGIRNLILKMGYTPAEAFLMGSTVPAEYLGIEGLGHMREGFRACLSAWDEGYNCEWSMTDGALNEGE